VLPGWRWGAVHHLDLHQQPEPVALVRGQDHVRRSTSTPVRNIKADRPRTVTSVRRLLPSKREFVRRAAIQVCRAIQPCGRLSTALCEGIFRFAVEDGGGDLLQAEGEIPGPCPVQHSSADSGCDFVPSVPGQARGIDGGIEGLSQVPVQDTVQAAVRAPVQVEASQVAVDERRGDFG
jgi:hypothetical protein